MPTYEYRCPKCGKEFEKFERRMTDRKTAKCPKCGTGAQRVISGGAGFLFKGSGFYITDYKRSGEKAEAREGGETKTESKSEPKASEQAAKPEKKSDDKPSKKPRSSGGDS